MNNNSKILIVDDIEANLIALELSLGSLDADFVKANSGAKALELCNSNEFALAIIDIQMPEMDGFELASLINQNKKNSYIPILFLSAFFKEDNFVLKTEQTGAVDFLSKPFNPALLLSKVTVFLDLYKQKKDLQLYAIELKKAKEESEQLYIQIQREIEVAKEIEDDLFPDEIPNIDGLDMAVEILQARKVGGDYYDMIPINDHEIALLVADVSGHDIASAFIVGMAKISFTAHIATCKSPANVFTKVNEDMCKVIKSDRFLSAFLIYIDTHSKKARYACAGHFKQGFYKKKSRTMETLHAKGFLLGAFEDVNFVEESFDVVDGDKIVLFTDGLFENTSTNNEQFGEPRLHSLIEKEGYNDVSKMHNNILLHYNEFCKNMVPNDDICLLIAEIKVSQFYQYIEQSLGGFAPTIPARTMNTEVEAKDTVIEIITQMDIFNFPDDLIRQYRRDILLIAASFRSSKSAKHSSLTAAIKIDEEKFTFVLLIKSDESNTDDFFNSPSCRNIVLHFSHNFGDTSVNEIGTRLLFDYKKDEKVELEFQDIDFKTKDDGVYLKVPSNLAPSRTIESIESGLISSNILNANFTAILRLLELKSNKYHKIGPKFKFYNQKLDSIYFLKTSPMLVEISLLEDKENNLKLTEEDILFVLKKKRIIFGIQTDTIKEMIKEYKFGKSYIIAIGDDVVNGVDGKIIERLTIDISGMPRITDDGNTDFKTLDVLRIVKKDDVILELIPFKPGSAGRSVYNRTVDPKIVKEKELIAGENTEIIENKMVAQIDGYLYRDKSGIHVGMAYYIKTNVDYSTGNVNYPGDVYIEGSVLSGFKVETGGNIYIKGDVEAAELNSKNGSITIDGGVHGKSKCRIEAKDNLTALFFQNVDIKCGGNLKVKANLLHCNATVKGKIQVAAHGKGSIIGGSIYCSKSIETSELGSPQGISTSIFMTEKTSTNTSDKISLAKLKRKDLNKLLLSISEQISIKGKVLKRKRTTTIEEKSNLEEMLKKFYLLKQQITNINNLLDFLNSKLSKEMSFEKIQVSKSIFSNVHFQFGDLELKTHSTIGAAELLVEDNDIKLLPFS